MDTLKAKAKKFAEDHRTLINRVSIAGGAVLALGGYLYADRHRVTNVAYVSNDHGRERILLLQKNGDVKSFSRPVKTD